MKKVIVSLLLTIIFCTLPAFSQKEKNELDASQKAFIVSRFCTEVKYNFVHYNNLPYNWDSLCMANLPSLTTTQSDEDFINGLKQLCAQLHDGHTFIYQTKWSKNPKEWPRSFPIATKRVGDQVFVTSVHNSEFKKQGISYGCEILEIDGEKVLEYANKHITPYLASSTQQWSDYAPFRGYELTNAIGTKISRMLLRSPKGKIITIESDRNIPWDIPADSSVFEYKVLDGNIGLLSIKSFLNDDFRREEFDKIYEQILKTNALIIDIRDNGGGNSDHADYIIRHFNDQPVRLGRWSSRMYIAAHGSWDYPQEWFMESPNPMEPVKDKPIYKKPIALLINATTFSSAENFSVTYRGLNRGKIIGTPTGGSTGNPIFIDLGFGLGCSICTKNEWEVDGRNFIGIGIVPDIEVKENADIFLKNKDIVIEKALEILKDSL
ncbi:S41 family peptidase [Parabacteroides sp.]|uniref:S41 family peptidase n=1 Tax=Parabacteroides sp. TaxID=1869337 RepID=UPI0030808282